MVETVTSQDGSHFSIQSLKAYPNPGGDLEKNRDYSHHSTLAGPLPALGKSTWKLTALAIDTFRLFSTTFNFFETTLITGRIIGRSRRHISHNLLKPKSAGSRNTVVERSSGSISGPPTLYFREMSTARFGFGSLSALVAKGYAMKISKSGGLQ